MIPLPERAPGQVGRERILPTLVAILAALQGIEARLAVLEARPATVQVREWKPNHRRLVDGGTPVRRQRRNVAKIVKAEIRRVG